MKETAEFWKKHNYEMVLTEDQSPTLRWLASDKQETMHHRGGAYSETQLIYGDVLREALQAGAKSAISVGLGLGYNEILTSLEALKHGISPDQFQFLSFESDPFLKEHFLSWVQEEKTDLIYDQIFSFFKDADQKSVKSWLHRAHQSGHWILEAALNPDFHLKRKYECIFYDAFSSKTSPHLWQEEFLKTFFHEACASRAWLSTYACTGGLKRALKDENFQVTIKEGFQSKRDRTFAFRDLISIP